MLNWLTDFQGVTLTMLLMGALGVSHLCYLISRGAAHRWRVRQRERMTRWQRRVDAGLEHPPGFEGVARLRS